MLRMIHLRRKRHWVLIPFACLLSGTPGRDKSRFERRKICPLQTSLSAQQRMLSDLIEDPHLQSSRMWNTSDPRYSTGMSIPSGKVNNQVIAENDTTGGLRSSLNDIIIERLVTQYSYYVNKSPKCNPSSSWKIALWSSPEGSDLCLAICEVGSIWHCNRCSFPECSRTLENGTGWQWCWSCRISVGSLR